MRLAANPVGSTLQDPGSGARPYAFELRLPNTETTNEIQRGIFA